MFVAFHNALDIARTLKPIVDGLKTRDADLARQIRRAAASISLNVLEGSKRAGKDRLHSYRIAAGSYAEVRAALALSAACGRPR